MEYRKRRKGDPITEATIDFWQRLGMDSVATLTFNENRRSTPRSYRAVSEVVTKFLMKQGVKGPVSGVVEPHADGRLHCHIAYVSGETKHRDLHDAWYHSCGLSEIHPAEPHACKTCTRENCGDQRVGGGCHDFEYIARKMTNDGPRGDRYIERTIR